ncbi:MAG: trypsin-like serine peptidase, partial [Bdellovibrionota bacterium]
PAKPLPKPLPGPPKPAPAPVDDSDLALQQAKAMNALLACQHNDCDASVGLLTVVLKIPQEGWIVGQCTASLVGPDILATNGHCIPADLVAAGSNCDGRMWITFAKDPAHPEYDKQIGCSSVLFRRKDGGLEGADYAYLKLAHASNRPVLRQSQAGFEDQKVYHLHKINPGELEGGMMGELVKVDCLSMYDSAIFPERLDRLSQTSLLVDCPVLKGNSGSPILADDGTIHGVIYSFVTNAVARQVLDKNGSSLPSIENIADLNLGSNFACLTLPGDPDGRSLPPACANSLEHLARARAAAQNLVAKAIHGSVQAQISAHAAGHPDALAFGWTSTTSNSGAMGTVAQAVPECVNHTAATGFLNRNGKVHRAFFFVKATYDKYLRASNYVPTWQGFAKTAEDMQLTQAADSSFQLDITSSTSGQAEFNASLPACGAPVAHR